jgi:hypothetical protein
MATNATDENTASEASTESGELGSPSTTQTETSKGDVSNQSLSDFLKDKVPSEKASKENDKSDTVESEEEDSDAQNLNATTEEQPDAEKKKEGEEEVKGDEKEEVTDEKDESEEGKDRTAEGRIKELVQERDSFKTEFEAVKPKVESYDKIDGFCKDYGITPEQFNKVMEIQALLNTDPAKALERLQPIVDSLKGFVGDKLPTDLQSKVDTGKLELDDAKEMARLRAQIEFGTRKSQFDSQRMQQSQAQSLQQQMAQSFQTWETARRTSDPDYKPKAKETDPDGKWELTKDKYLALLNETRVVNGQVQYINPVRTPSEMISLVDKAYTAVNGAFSRFSGKKPPTRKHLSSNGSSGTSTKKTIEEAGSLAEVASMVLPGRR